MSNTSTLPKPTEDQLGAASRILNQFAIGHGGTASDQHQRRAVYAILAVLTGRPGAVPEEYQPAIGEPGVLISVGGGGLEAPDTVEGVMVPNDDYYRMKTILEGITVGEDKGNLLITVEAAELIGLDEMGIYVPNSFVLAATEAALALKAKESADLGFGDEEDEADEQDGLDDEGEDDLRLTKLTITQLRGMAGELGVKIQTGSDKKTVIKAIQDAKPDEAAFTAALSGYTK